jgi:hypothetical protein
MNKKLGYYTCNNKEFSSKIDACIYSNTVKMPIAWHFNDTVFQSYDWQIEPELTLDELYNQRAKQIREQYDYIIISYSGGADSNNILESFLRQGLFIDEILVNTMEERDNLTVANHNEKSAWNAGAEHKLQTIPRLQYIKDKSPNTKINVIDMSKYVFDSLETAGDASWILNKREMLNIGAVTRYNYVHFKEVRNQFDKNKKIALIVGVDKPRGIIINGEFKIMFNDRAANVVTAQEHLSEYPNATVENFYWSPESVPMLIKQGHVLKKWLEAFPQYIPLWTLTDNDTYSKNFRLVHERMLRNIIYTTWDQNWYQADKSVLDWFNEFDDWFITKYNNTKAFSIWKSGIEHVLNNASDYMVYKNDKPYGLKVFLHSYSLGKMKVLQELIK